MSVNTYMLNNIYPFYISALFPFESTYSEFSVSLNSLKYGTFEIKFSIGHGMQ